MALLTFDFAPTIVLIVVFGLQNYVVDNGGPLGETHFVVPNIVTLNWGRDGWFYDPTILYGSDGAIRTGNNEGSSGVYCAFSGNTVTWRGVDAICQLNAISSYGSVYTYLAF